MRSKQKTLRALLFVWVACTGAATLLLYGQDSSAKTMFDSGNRLFKEGNFSDAIAYYTGAIQADGQFAKAYTRRGAAKRNKGEAAGALQDLSRAIELDPKDGEAYYNRGLIAVTRRDARAVEDLDQAVQLEPKNGDVVYARGLAREIKGDSAGAIADYSKAIDLDAKHLEAYQSRGMIKFSVNDVDGAIADFTRVLQITRNADTYYERAAARSVKGDHDGAIADYGQLLGADPDDVRARFRRGISKADKRDFKGALSDIQKASEQRTSDDIQLRMWLVRAQLGDRQPATKDLLAYFEKRPAVTAVSSANIAKFLAGQTTEADLLKLAEPSSTDLEKEFRCRVYFFIGELRLLDKDPTAAADHFQKSVATGKSRIPEYASAAAELRTLSGKK